jgi:hypothetical protein
MCVIPGKAPVEVTPITRPIVKCEIGARCDIDLPASYRASRLSMRMPLGRCRGGKKMRRLLAAAFSSDV